MKKHYLAFLVLLCSLGTNTHAQIIATDMFIRGTFTEVGQQNNGAFGICVSPPAGYHAHCASCFPSTGFAEVYDYGHDGWATGAPVHMGDYTFPGSPFEGWELQIGANRTQAFQGCPNGTYINGGAGVGLTGSNTGYAVGAGRVTGTWTGTASGGNLQIRQETRIDQTGSAIVVTTVMKNISGGSINGVYYMRSCDPDNDQTWPGGGFFTNNTIVHQNEDARHRVMVSSTGATGAISYCALGTKDCRAHCCIYDSWPMSSAQDLAAVWNGTNPGSTHNLGGTRNNDIAIALVYNLGNIAAGDSTIISYAYIYNGNLGIDSAFPDPKIVINGVPHTSWAPPTPNYDTFDFCLHPGVTSIPVDILNAEDKDWSWSKWTWSPGLGLSATTGCHVTITAAGLPPIITYTITGTDSATGMYSCHKKVFYLTIKTCNSAVSNSPCEGDTLWLNAPGDSTGATYAWYGPAPYAATAFSNTQKTFRFPATVGMSGTYRVIKTVAGIPDTSTVDVLVYARPVAIATSSLPICAPITNTVNLFCNTDSVCNAWSWKGPQSFTSGIQNPSVNPFDITKEGVYTVVVTSLHGCKDTATVLVKPGPAPIVGPSGVCQYFSITMTDATPGGVWSSTNPAIATISSTGVVQGHLPGTTVISYIMPNTCGTATTVTVHGKPLPPIIPEVRPCQFKPVNVLTVTVTGPGYTTTWYGPGVTPPMPFSSGVSTITPPTDSAGTTYYYVTQTSPFGCVSDSALYPVRIVPEPHLPLTHDTSYCQHDPLVAPLLAYGDSLRWYTTLTAPPGTGAWTPPVPSVTNPGVTIYYVTQEITGCESPKAPLKVTILYKPDFKIIPERDWVCQYDSLTFTNTAPSGMVDPGYIWQLPVGADFVNGTHFYDHSMEARFDTVWGRHDIFLTISTYKGRCATTEMATIKVIPAPDAHLYIKPDVCVGDTITLALNSHSDNSHNYIWNVDGVPMTSAPGIKVITANVNSGGPYLISWIDSGIHVFNVSSSTKEGCAAEPTADTIKVHTLPNPLFSVSQIPKKFCVEDSVLFTANVKDYGYNYKWEPEHSFSNQNKPEIWGKVEQLHGKISLTVTDPFGCHATYTKQMNPDECCSVNMPNAFTPNGDGKNDRYHPLFDGYRRFHIFRVINRWGQTVFETANSEPSWDGTYNGIMQDMGTYYYYLKYDCGGSSHELKGDVTLIR